ncbi:MAG: hypothetical protein PHI85_06430 [Victivallaceae bacterium]|nr:hypothetical protein [Victivallaceae bacterium]
MKKFLFVLCSCLLGAGVFAAEQISRINPNKGVGFKVGGSLSLFITVNGMSALPAGITNFGYYKIDATGNPLMENGKYVGGEIDTGALANNGAAQVGDFNRGDTVVFWMKDENGNYLDSYYRGDKGDDRNAVYEGNNGKNNTSVSMGYIDSRPGWAPSGGSGSLSFTVEIGKVPGDNKPPSGMPLPGVLSTLLAGGAVSVWMMRRRRERRR